MPSHDSQNGTVLQGDYPETMVDLKQEDYPKKSKVCKTRLMDSTVWDNFQYREGDIVIATFCKSGTTWTQQIVAQLVFGGQELDSLSMSFWLDFRNHIPQESYDKLERQAHRRFIKTHQPRYGLDIHPSMKYICIARDGRDAMISLHHHWLNITDELVNFYNREEIDGPLIQIPKEGERQFILDVMSGTTTTGFWDYWDHVRSWWEVRDLPNVMLLHFSHLKADLPGSIRRVADFLGIGIKDDDTFKRIVEHCSFEHMKSKQLAPGGGHRFKGGGGSFFNKGEHGQWKDILTAEDVVQYEKIACEQLGEACAHWLKTGTYM